MAERMLTREEVLALAGPAEPQLSREEVLALAQAPPPDPGTAAERGEQVFGQLSPVEQFGVGVAKPVVELVGGIRSLLAEAGLGDKLSDEEIENLALVQQAKGGLATAGEIAGDVATLALPGGAAAAGGKAAVGAVSRALPRALAAWAARTAPAAALAGETAVTAGAEALKAPEGERLDAARDAAIGGLAAGTVLGAGRKALGGVTEAAKELLDAGVPLTPGMLGGEGWAWFERKLSELPGPGGAAKRLQDAAKRGWNRTVLKEAAPTDAAGKRISAAGREGFEQLQTEYRDAYNDIWRAVTPQTLAASRAVPKYRAVAQALPRLPARTRAEVEPLMRAVREDLTTFSQTGDPRLVEALDDYLRKADMPDELGEDAVRALRDVVREALPPDTAAKLAQVDKSYAKYKTLERAASYVKGLEDDSVINPRQLQTAIKARSTPGQAVRGQGLMQREADLAQETLGLVTPARSQIATGADIAPYAIGAAGITNPAATAAALAGACLATTEPVRRAAVSARRYATDPGVTGRALARALRQAAGTQSGS